MYGALLTGESVECSFGGQRSAHKSFSRVLAGCLGLIREEVGLSIDGGWGGGDW